MYLSSRDIKWAIQCGKLIVDPPPERLVPAKGYDETSIDLHLGHVDKALVWDLDALSRSDRALGRQTDGSPPSINLGDFDFNEASDQYLKPVPVGDGHDRLVFRLGDSIYVRKFGFLVWTTKEWVGTPEVDLVRGTDSQRHPELICFVNAKSTRARTGLMVHFTAPTIHANWGGNVTLEITNLGPFTFVLKEGDALAQLTVATISSAPDLSLKVGKSKTRNQVDPRGAPVRPS